MTAHTEPTRLWSGRSRAAAVPEPPRPPLPYLARTVAAPVVVTGSAGVWLVAAADGARVPAAVGATAGVVLLAAAAVVAATSSWRARRLEEQLAQEEADTARFAGELLPALIDRLTHGDSAASALAAITLPRDETRRRALTLVAEELATSESRRAAAMSAGSNAAGRMQALTTSMLADLREMEHRHSDPAVLGDLLHLDHRTAQAGRLADSIAVLAGARSGRRWAKPIRMESILRGAMGRISGYQRVRLHSSSEVAIVGHAAEGVMHALAELMDNAANFSPPTAEVHVYVEEVPAGAVITIEDSGLVMGEVALRRAESAVAANGWDLTGLSGTRLGLVVVGRLARKHGLKVSFRPSARGGTGVVVMVPQELITRPRAGGTADAESVEILLPDPLPVAPRPDPAPAAAPSRTQAGDAAAEPDTGTESPEYGESGLPKRRRGRTLAAARHVEASAGARRSVPRDDDTPAARAARFSTFRGALKRKPSPAPDPSAAPHQQTATDPESDSR
ncbi:sensor histidine kinase [Streptomyces sp. MI02-7b]|uniref:sensor histidine kinase n=1 Tax=Streptomyces sp. MI02-7b TaxID=462941 RepID=UPI0029B43A1C|nr:ATP-binding protein [Streptomyces sp. MI02-7b]MDX3072815.1 ATP-binding protein [Streptomyces sp. MI02-7b]